MTFSAWLGSIIGGTAMVFIVGILLRTAEFTFDTEAHRLIATLPIYLFGALIGGACSQFIFRSGR